MAKMIKIIVVLSVVSLLAVSVYAYFNDNYAKEDVYRPMCFYNNNLLWEEEMTGIDVSGLEYIGKINSCVGARRKPEKDFECNYENWLDAELYKDENSDFYIKFLNGRTYKLRAAGDSRIAPANK